MRIKLLLIQLISLGCICLYPDLISLESYTGTLSSGEVDSLTVTITADSVDFGIYSYQIKVSENGSVTHIIPVEVEVFPAYLAAPANLQISVTVSGSELSWEAVAGAEGYHIFRSDQPGSGFTQIGTTEATFFSDLNGSSRSFYRIIAYYTETEVRRKADE